MPHYISFSLPKQDVSREVLEADLPYYLGRDAKIVESHKADKYVIEASREPPQSMLSSLRNDTSRWRRSDDYSRRMRYAESTIHHDRKRACRSQNDHDAPLTRYESRGSTSASSTTGVAPIAVPQRPGMGPRNASNASSVFGSMRGSPGSTYGSMLSPSSSRRPSDATSLLDPGMRSRAMSVSSVSSEYGTNGGYGFNNDPAYGTNGGYGFANSPTGPPSYISRR